MIDKYRNVPYIKGGRDLSGLDCWGLVRLVRIDLGKEELPLYNDVNPLDKKSFTKRKVDCVKSSSLEECEAKEGAIVCGFMGKLCYHVGIVVKANGRLMVLETDIGIGVSLLSISTFKSKYSKVLFYD